MESILEDSFSDNPDAGEAEVPPAPEAPNVSVPDPANPTTEITRPANPAGLSTPTDPFLRQDLGEALDNIDRRFEMEREDRERQFHHLREFMNEMRQEDSERFERFCAANARFEEQVADQIKDCTDHITRAATDLDEFRLNHMQPAPEVTRSTPARPRVLASIPSAPLSPISINLPLPQLAADHGPPRPARPPPTSPMSELLACLRSDKKKLTSGLTRTLASSTVTAFKWPQEYIVRPNGTTPKFDALTMAEFIYGFNMMIKAIEKQGLYEKVADLRLLLDEILYDLREVEFTAVRRSIRAIFLQIEQGVLTWSDHQEIKELRHLEISRALREKPTATTVASSTASQGTTLICFPYQRNECKIQGSSHQSARGTLHHACQYCLSITGNKFPHPEADCRRKKTSVEKGKEADSKEE